MFAFRLPIMDDLYESTYFHLHNYIDASSRLGNISCGLIDSIERVVRSCHNIGPRMQCEYEEEDTFCRSEGDGLRLPYRRRWPKAATLKETA